jgi:hypothetical protein
VGHAGDPEVFEAFGAARVDAAEHFDAVPGPGGDLGVGDAGVEPPGDAGVAQVVGAFHGRCGELAAGEGGGPDLLPDLPPGGGLDGVAALGTEQAAVGAGAVGRDVLAQQGDELRGDRDFARACGRRGWVCLWCGL